MVIYEVNLELEPTLKQDFDHWLNPHIEQILKLPGFIEAQWHEVQVEEKNKIRYCIHYHLKDLNSLDRYFANEATSYREDALNRFGNRFTATRRILTNKKSFKSTQ